MIDADVIIAGAGPTGLMLASELLLAGTRPLVLEREPELGGIPKAYGVGGQIVQLLRYRGLLDRLSSVGASIGPAAGFPFGGLQLDFTGLTDPPLRAERLPQRRLERLLDAYVRELGGEIRRGHDVTGVSQDDAEVTVTVSGPNGPYRVSARYAVGCDGAYSRTRETAGIPFDGTTYPEVNRLGQVTVPDSVNLLEDGRLEVPGSVSIPAGVTRTEHGAFAFGLLGTGELLVQTTETEPGDADDATPMTRHELGDSISRVLGVDLPLGRPMRLSRYRIQARQAERYRHRRLFLAGDAAHLFPATGMGLNVGMLDAVNLAWKLAADVAGWAPDDLLDTYHDERHYAGGRAMLQTRAQAALRRGPDADADALRWLWQELVADEQPLRRLAALIAGTDIRYTQPYPAEHALTGKFAPDLQLRSSQGITSVAQLMHGARPVLLVLADRPELLRAAKAWCHRVDIHVAESRHRPADALLIRPDAHVAWAATHDESGETATAALCTALRYWFGEPCQPAESTDHEEPQTFRPDAE